MHILKHENLYHNSKLNLSQFERCSLWQWFCAYDFWLVQTRSFCFDSIWLILIVLTQFDSFLLLTTHFNFFRLVPTINNSFQHIPTSSKTKRVSSSSSIFYSEMWKLLRREEKHQKLLVKPQKQQQQRKHLVMRWVLSWHSDLLLDWVQSFESSLERGLGPAFSFHFIH